MIFVTGTGRCGTLSICQTLADHSLKAVHEPNGDILAIVAAFWPQGMSDHEALIWLQRVQYMEVASCFLFVHLAPLLDRLFPNAQWVWVTRNAPDTVASMIARRWWLPEDDEAWPVVMSHPAGDSGGILSSAPWQCRPNGYTTGEMSFREWRTLPQAGRAAWWWDHVYRTMKNRHAIRYPVELQRPDSLMSLLGIPWKSHVIHRANPSPRRPELPADAQAWIDRFCAEGMDDLYRGWDGTGRYPEA